MPYTRVHAEVHEYDVFARKTRVEPLHQVGSVVAPDDNLAMAYARATYDEERWVEMMSSNPMAAAAMSASSVGAAMHHSA